MEQVFSQVIPNLIIPGIVTSTRCRLSWKFLSLDADWVGLRHVKALQRFPSFERAVSVK